MVYLLLSMTKQLLHLWFWGQSLLKVQRWVIIDCMGYKHMIIQQGVRVDQLLNQTPEPALSGELREGIKDIAMQIKYTSLLPRTSKSHSWQPWLRSGSAGKLLKATEAEALYPRILGWRKDSEEKRGWEFTTLWSNLGVGKDLCNQHPKTG